MSYNGAEFEAASDGKTLREQMIARVSRKLEFFNSQGMPSGAFHDVVPLQRNSNNHLPNYFSDGMTLEPLARMDGVLPHPALDAMVEAARVYTGQPGENHVTSKFLIETKHAIQKMIDHGIDPAAEKRLHEVVQLTQQQELKRMRLHVPLLNRAIDQGEPLWIVVRYQENGQPPRSGVMSELRFAARLYGFALDEQRAAIVPVVWNAHDTEYGLLSDDVTPWDYSGGWLFMESGEKKRHFEDFFNSGFSQELPLDS